MRVWLRRQYANIELTDRKHDPGLWDYVLAGLLLAASVCHIIVVEAVLSDFDMHWPLAQLGVDIGVVALVLYRRRWPLACQLLGLTVITVYAAIHVIHGDPMQDQVYVDFVTVGTVFAILTLMYSAFRWLPSERVWQGWFAALLMMFNNYLHEDYSNAWEYVGQAFLNSMVMFSLAMAMRYRSRLQEQRVVEVRLEERQELARELHDVVAHHVSVIAIQAQAAQAVASTDPAAVLTSLSAIEETASLTLREMRRMVGILRAADDDTGGDTAPMVGTLTLHDLASAPGSPIVRLHGAELVDEDVPLAVRAAVLRITQESITNARNHGSKTEPIDVVVSYYDEAISLVITNTSRLANVTSGGFGLIGMEERAESLGGTLSAGPLPDGRWRVTARLPIYESAS